MPSGRLGAADISPNTNTTVYTVPTGKVAMLSVSICNRGAVEASVRLAISTTGTPSGAEWLEYGAKVPAGTPLERTGIVLDAGKMVVAHSTVGSVNVVAYGVEEDA